jgi:hypothetical protein
MAHFAKLNNENIVEQVIVIANEAMLDYNGVEVEKLGLDICRHLYNWDNWKQTSYNDTFRGKFAAVGDYYDASKDEFIKQ